MNYNTQIEDAIKNLYKQRFINEIEHLEETHIKDMESSSNEISRLEILKYILSKIEIADKNKKGDIYDEIEKHIYTRPWKNLKDCHKIIKLTEYVNSNFKNTELKTILIKELCQMICDKKLGNECLVYEYRLQKILYLKNLKLCNNNKGYKLV